jgi:thiamine transporter ThiT
MFLALLRLDFGAAWRYNAVALVLFFLWNGIAGAVFLGKPAFARKSAFLYGALIASIAMLAVFGIVRNL